jgi:hypothetical membrane protein
MRSQFNRPILSITLIAGICGAFLPVVIFTCLGFALASSPWFDWTHHALSDLGISATSAAFFNYGMVLGGILLFVFSLGLLQVLSKKMGAYLFILSSCTLMGIGVFNETLFPLHFVTSASFFILLTSSLFFIGVTAKQDTIGLKMGLLSLLFSLVAVCSTIFFFYAPGIAIPEALSCFPAFFWCMVVGFKMMSIHTSTASQQGIKHLQ